MQYLLIWIVAIAIGVLLFREYFWINIIIMFVLHLVNHRRCGEFTKYAMTTLLPVATTQVISVTLGKQISRAYIVWMVPILEQCGIPISEDFGEQVPFVMAMLLFLTMEAFSIWWVNVPIQRNYSSCM